MERLHQWRGRRKIDIAGMRWEDDNLIAAANEAQAHSQIRD
jgi:hypothetical protein